MIETLLTSEEFVKRISNISDNISGKLLLPAIREAQNTELRGILGDNLLDKLCDLVADNQINLPENVNYKRLLDKCQYFLAYSAISDIIILTSVKIDNAGNEQVSDEKMQPISISDSFRLQKYYQHKVDYFCKQIQDFILKNKSNYPELNCSDVHSIKSNLYSAASTGLWLGGRRGLKY